MAPALINGKVILEALADLREPSTMAEILRHVSKQMPGQTKEQLQKSVKAALSAGVRYGYLEACQDYYYTMTDAVDALEDVSDVGSEVESICSMPSVKGGSKEKSKAGRSGRRSAGKSNKSEKKVTITKAKKSIKDVDTEEEDSDDDEEFDEEDDDIEEEDSAEEVPSPKAKHSSTCPYDCPECRKRRGASSNRSRSRSAHRNR